MHEETLEYEFGLSFSRKMLFASTRHLRRLIAPFLAQGVQGQRSLDLGLKPS